MGPVRRGGRWVEWGGEGAGQGGGGDSWFRLRAFNFLYTVMSDLRRGGCWWCVGGGGGGGGDGGGGGGVAVVVAACWVSVCILVVGVYVVVLVVIVVLVVVLVWSLWCEGCRAVPCRAVPCRAAGAATRPLPAEWLPLSRPSLGRRQARSSSYSRQDRISCGIGGVLRSPRDAEAPRP